MWFLSVCLGVTAASARPALAVDLGGLVKKAAGSAGGAAQEQAFKKVNAKLLAEGRKNQCAFKSDSDQLMPGCDSKVKKLADTLVQVKKQLQAAGVTAYKFEVLGYTDTTGKPDPQQGPVGQAGRRHREGARRQGHPAERDHPGGEGRRQPGRHAGRHGGEEEEEPPLRDSGQVAA